MIEFYASPSLHLIFECAKLISLSTITRTKMWFLASSILWVGLSSEGGSGIVSLISVWSPSFVGSSSSFRESPSWEVLFFRWVGTSFRDVSARSNTIGRWSLIFDYLTSSCTEGIFFWIFVNWLFLWSVLWSWVLFKVSTLEPWLCSDFWSQASWFSWDVCFNWIIKEQSVLIKVIFRFIFSNSDFGSHWPVGCLKTIVTSYQRLLTPSYLIWSW